MYSCKCSIECGTWIGALADAAKIALRTSLKVLRVLGLGLRVPHSFQIRTSLMAGLRALEFKAERYTYRAYYPYIEAENKFLIIMGYVLPSVGFGAFQSEIIPDVKRIYDTVLGTA